MKRWHTVLMLGLVCVSSRAGGFLLRRGTVWHGGYSRRICLAGKRGTGARAAVVSATRNRHHPRRLPAVHAHSDASANADVPTIRDSEVQERRKPLASSHQPALSRWNGNMTKFSDFSTHVEVANGDAPVTVETAILRSMLALGSAPNAIRGGGDGGTAAASETNRGVFVIEDDPREVGRRVDEAGQAARTIGSRLKDHPQNQPISPREMLYLGSVWYLPAEHYRKNQELELEQNQQQQQQQQLGRETNKKTNQYKPHNRVKPVRLSLSNATMVLQGGDYLRIHHTPRRFHRVYEADWSFPSSNSTAHQTDDSPIESDKNGSLPMVIQQRGRGYCIIDKPPLIPVHSTVDNNVETVASQLLLSLEEEQRQQRNASDHDAVDPPYLVPVQRIDVNTSGLLVLATSPEFAAYFSELLRRKTATILDQSGNSTGTGKSARQKTNNTTGRSNKGDGVPTVGIQKGYKCLVCIQPDKSSGESVVEAWRRLSNLQRPKDQSPSKDDNGGSEAAVRGSIIRHYLKASDRAPKLFVDTLPEEANGDDDSKWYECLMEITDVGEPIPLFSSDSIQRGGPADGLWPKAAIDGGFQSRIPPNTKAVAEVEVSLITGRTHQIRGQLSKLGYPIVGDEQYGGALQLPEISGISHETGSFDGGRVESEGPLPPQLLALQCSYVGFPEAEYELTWHKKKRRDVLRGRPSKSGRTIQQTLERAWWTPVLEQLGASEETGEPRFSDIDFEDGPHERTAPIESSVEAQRARDAETTSEAMVRPDLLPPAVQLSPGRNKYIVARLRDPITDRLRWFVRSAPLPYHADVALDLLEWIGSVPGYTETRVEVTGGGRIDYDEALSTVSVYGFSYRYGKGDHVRVAQLIQDSSFGGDNTVSYDLSDALY
ncbi:unnamed protein product [Pseudo-nitzschia multistriata]|uniref:Pseudouridine synthase RsuA/RluA-like domain-containing protein n=1 Tax=Pseudo-nitzschia multistriata TaxID=183589 RepID=A0A448Z5R8_9STRA|nr:unnamed protein product [Pseudo-nitzschia multistriata]